MGGATALRRGKDGASQQSDAAAPGCEREGASDN